MKRLKWPTNAEEAEYMRLRTAQNRANCHRSRAESWAFEALRDCTGLKWSRQRAWGNRIFDFWNNDIGCAVEIDGPEHNPRIDEYRDEYVFRRSAIVVLRVANFDESALKRAVTHIVRLGAHSARKAQIGINANTKAGKRWIADLPYPPRYLRQYLNEHVGLNGRPFVINQTSPKFEVVKLMGTSTSLPVRGDDEQLACGIDDVSRR